MLLKQSPPALVFVVSLLTLIHFLHAQKTSTLYNQLVQVNEQWKNQLDTDFELENKPSINMNEQELIQFHLQETEKLLRKRNTDHLSASLKKSREANLNTLHTYWQNGVFPVNDKYLDRQPYFIDKYNTYCAVGYLMQQSGADEMAKDINRRQNYSYLSDISHPNLMKWVAASGLSFDELALIQPGYGGEWPAAITEMHYTNAGADVNQYIEVHQSNGGLIGMIDFAKILFYDYSGLLYKTLPIDSMQIFYRNNTENNDKFYYYQFALNEKFADSGKIELKGSYSDTLSTYTYNSSGITLIDNLYGRPQQRFYSVAEDNYIPAGSSLTFCGLYLSTWSPAVLPATPGSLNTCTKGALPVTLSSFNYNVNNKIVQLTWATASESNNDYFNVEKSNDGINFRSIGKVKGTGTSSITKHYSFNDNNPDYINHYRLKQVDRDGKFSYSKILFVKVPKANPLVLLQNAAKNSLQVQINLPSTNRGSIIIYDFLAREVLQLKAISGNQNIDISSLSAGKYIIRLFTKDGQIYNGQFMKQ